LSGTTLRQRSGNLQANLLDIPLTILLWLAAEVVALVEVAAAVRVGY
jgi:hypothetical protein